MNADTKHTPECCRDCGAPFNDADAPASGLCAECSADSYDHDQHQMNRESANDVYPDAEPQS